MNTNDSLWNDLVACKQQQREIQDNLQKILYFLMTVHNTGTGASPSFLSPHTLTSLLTEGEVKGIDGLSATAPAQPVDTGLMGLTSPL